MVSILLLYYGRKSKQSYERYLPARTSGGPELPDSVTCVFSSTSHGTEGIRAVGFRMAYTETHAGARYDTLNASLLPQRINRGVGVTTSDTSRHITPPCAGWIHAKGCSSPSVFSPPCNGGASIFTNSPSLYEPASCVAEMQPLGHMCHINPYLFLPIRRCLH